MVIFERQNLIKIYTKTHHFKKNFSGEGHAPDPPPPLTQHTTNFPQKNISCPPPPRQILATPLESTIL